jgi:hypothetical protein
MRDFSLIESRTDDKKTTCHNWLQGQIIFSNYKLWLPSGESWDAVGCVVCRTRIFKGKCIHLTVSTSPIIGLPPRPSEDLRFFLDDLPTVYSDSDYLRSHAAIRRTAEQCYKNTRYKNILVYKNILLSAARIGFAVLHNFL